MFLDSERPRARRVSAVSAAMLLPALVGDPALALPNPHDLIHRTVPASSCAPLDAGQSAKVRLQNGAWRFDGVSTGTVSLYCPLPMTAFPADNSEPNYTEMEFFRVWYRDSDGLAVNARVTANLRYRDLDGGWKNAHPGTFNSNVFANTGFAAKIFGAIHTFETDAIYSFYITIYRANSDQTVEFHGIDFRDGSQPEG
jgi:hypothetical protein